MAVSSAHIAVGGFYVRFAEVREVMSVARSGDVTFLSRSKTGGRQSVTLTLAQESCLRRRWTDKSAPIIAHNQTETFQDRAARIRIVMTPS